MTLVSLGRKCKKKASERRRLPRPVAVLLAAAAIFALLSSATVCAEQSSEYSIIPTVSAKSAVLIDGEGEILYEKNALCRMPMASTTKIMTALLALERCDPSETVTVDPRAVGTEGSSIYLTAGEQLTMRELVLAIMLESANDAAAAAAYHISGGIDEFAELMNSRARELGLSETHFENPHGLDSEQHFTTACDLAALAACALKNPDFAEIVATRTAKIPNGDGFRVLSNHNRMLGSYDGAVGVKTGFTKKSGRCLVTAATRDGLTLIAVTLSAPDDWNDHKKLLDFGFSRFVRVALGENFSYSLPVAGTGASVNCLTAEALTLTLPRGHEAPTVTVELPRFLYPPVKKGDRVGRAVFSVGSKPVGELPLYAAADVAEGEGEEKPGFLRRVLMLFDKLFK